MNQIEKVTENDFPCGTTDQMLICAGNSDANCFRERTSYSIKLVNKHPETCIACPYVKCEFRMFEIN